MQTLGTQSRALPPASDGMSVVLANYLFFTDQCEAALRFYEECGLGQITLLQHHGLGLGRVLHARFDGDDFHFYASDNDDAEPMRGSAQMLTFAAAAPALAMFNSLAAGGTITSPIGPYPWSAIYGKLTDRFGVQWMVTLAATGGRVRQCLDHGRLQAGHGHDV